MAPLGCQVQRPALLDKVTNRGAGTVGRVSPPPVSSLADWRSARCGRLATGSDPVGDHLLLADQHGGTLALLRRALHRSPGTGRPLDRDLSVVRSLTL